MSKRDYSSWTKPELLAELQKIQAQKKFGLVWEDQEEEESSSLSAGIPVAKEVPSRKIVSGESPKTNLLIEGDNLHSISLLNYTHYGQVDLIYIDPPYNTGNKSWKYNNDYVDKDDAYRHSKWISFMARRLKLARNLLTDSGVIVVAIDDYEIFTLGLLMDEIYGESNRLGTITVVHNPRGRNDDKFFATSHEFLLVYAKDSNLAEVGYFDLTEDDVDSYKKTDDISAYAEVSFMRTGNNSTRETRPNLFYPIYYDPSTQKLSLEKSKNSVELLPVNEANEEKTWRWGRETFLEKCETELHVREVKGKLRLFKKRRLTDSKGRKPKTVWTDSKYDASTHGIILLQKIFETKDVFPYPKSIHAVKDIVQLLSKPDSLILDFFAGSGTTGHAVLELNKSDNGTRSFILCTNNEGKIAEDVCYPRIAKVISGYGANTEASSKGIPANLRYFKVGLVSNSQTDANRKKLTREAVSLLSIRENAFKKEVDEPLLKVFSNSDTRTAILLDTSALGALLEEIEANSSTTYRVYVFSLANEDLADEFAVFGDRVKSLPVPEGILNTYYRTLGEIKGRS